MNNISFISLFIRAWFVSWPKRQPWKDALALLTLAAGAAFACILLSWKAYPVRILYQRAANRALIAKDYQTTRVACCRLMNLGEADINPTLYMLALATQGLGQTREASALFAKLAPIDKPVFAPAHLYVAQSLIASKDTSPETTQTVLAQLQRVLELNPRSQEANEILGRYYLQTRDWARAMKNLEVLVNEKPELHFLLIAAATELKDEQAAAKWKAHALAYYQAALKAAKGDDVKTRILCAQALVIESQFPTAVGVLAEGLRLSTNESYRFALADVYAAWAESLAKKEPQNLSARIDLIKRGLEMTPQNQKLLELLLAICRIQGPEASVAHELINKMLTEGGSSGILHFIMGSDAWERGDMELAKKHYLMAFDLAPEMPAVANNMAMLLAVGDHPDLPRALALIQSVAEKLPDEPNIRDTRGVILLKLGRYEEAVKDLEFALPRVQSKGPTHEGLAKAYAALGMTELAEEHKRLALPSPPPQKE